MRTVKFSTFSLNAENNEDDDSYPNTPQKGTPEYEAEKLRLDQELDEMIALRGKQAERKVRFGL